MIEKCALLAAPTEDTPAIAINERVYRPCGCACYIGHRLDTMEAAATAATCCDDHKPQMESFYDRLIESLSNPTPRPLAEVCDEFMEEAFSEAA